MRNPVSLTARLSLMFAASAAGVLLVAGLLFERAGDNQFLEHDREELSGKLELIRNELANVTNAQALAGLPLRLRDAVLGHPGIAIAVAQADGTVLFSTGPEGVVQHLLQGGEIGKTELVVWPYADHVYRIAAGRFALGMAGTPPASVAIALDITSDQQFRSAFQQFLWFGMFLAVLAMGWLGWVAVRKGLAPLHEVSATMANVSAQQLDRPMPTADVPRELQELVSSFNRMLGRLDESFRRLLEFSSDIAHDLRTPINNLMMQTQVTLSQERAAGDYRNTLQSNLEEFERLSRMITDMLFLAKADNKLVAPKREPIELHAEVERLREFYEALAADSGVRLTQSGAATIFADRLMIQRALSNLLSNAIRFTPKGMAIEVAIEEEPDGTTISVTNPGPEIPEDHLSHVFERMYRVDPSRREGGADNVGLGLAITRSIVMMHGGTIGVSSADGRTCFTIELPRTSGH
jgi:two-component system, OmpR family, heavy metal sensor histidine kinase CusS